MGWFSDVVDSVSNVVNDTVDLVGSAGQSTINAVKNHPVEIGLLAGGGYYAASMYPEAGALTNTLAPVEDATVKFTADMIDPNAVSGIDLGGAGASPASWTNATTATMTGSATGGWTAGQIASTVSSGLNLATSATKLSMLGKTMNASTPTADGLTGGLAAFSIQTPSGLITTTPQGPMMTGTQAASTGGFMGMDMQTLMVIAVGIAAVYYFSKNGK